MRRRGDHDERSRNMRGRDGPGSEAPERRRRRRTQHGIWGTLGGEDRRIIWQMAIIILRRARGGEGEEGGGGGDVCVGYVWETGVAA